MDTILLALVKQRKSEVAKKYTVPLHPEYVFVEALGDSMWHAQNKNTKEFVTVTKKENGEFFEFEVTQVS